MTAVVPSSWHVCGTPMAVSAEVITGPDSPADTEARSMLCALISARGGLTPPDDDDG
jgi:hypothetical protein